MAKKLTQKEKIEELELKNKQLKEDYDELTKICQDMEKKLDSKIINIEDAFIESPTYLQMKSEISFLKAKCGISNKNSKENEIIEEFIEPQKYLEMKKRINELETECKKLNEQLKQRKTREEKKHNERGAGAKVRFSSPAQLEQIYMMYESGNTMTDIAQHMGCSVATISRALKSYAQEKNNLQD